VSDERTQQEISDLVMRAASMFADGKNRNEVIAELRSAGATAEAAESIATDVQEIKSAVARDGGKTTMMIGAGIFVVGLAITLGTHEAAVSNGGGRFVVAYGAVIGGVWIFLKGLWRSMVG
jgi:hypothetical protein